MEEKLGSSIVASRGWINMFKARHGIVSKSECVDNGTVDTVWVSTANVCDGLIEIKPKCTSGLQFLSNSRTT